MDAMDRKALDAANQLQGTCKSIHDLGEEFEAAQNDDVFCRTLDSLVYCCVGCEWWFEAGDGQHEAAGGFACDDCGGGGDEE